MLDFEDLAINIACEESSYTDTYLEKRIETEYYNLEKNNLEKKEIVNQIRFKLSPIIQNYQNVNIHKKIEEKIYGKHMNKYAVNPNLKKKHNRTNSFSISSVKISDNSDTIKDSTKKNKNNIAVDDKPLIEYKIDFEENILIKQNKINEIKDDTENVIKDDTINVDNHLIENENEINHSIENENENNHSIGNEKKEKEKKEHKNHVVIPFDLSVQLLQNYIQENEIIDKNLIFFAVSNEMIENAKNGINIKSIDLTNENIRNGFIESQLFIVEDKLKSINERFEFINFKKNDKLKIIKSENFNNISYNDYQSIDINSNQIHIYLIDSILEEFQ